MPKLFKDCTEHKFFTYNSNRDERITIGQLMYQLSGVVIPRNISLYVNTYRKMLNYDIPEDYKTAIAFASAISKETINTIFENEDLEDRAFAPIVDDTADENSQFEEYDGKVLSAEKAEELYRKYREETNYIKKKNKELISDIAREKEKNKQNAKTIENLTSEIQDLQKENEMLQLSLNCVEEDDADDTDHSETIEFPYELKHKYIVFGGYDKMGVRLENLLKGDVTFETLKSGHYSKDALKHADVACILTKHIGHTPTYGIKNDAGKNGTQVLYLTFVNNEKNARALIKYDKKLCAEEEKRTQL